MNYIQITIPTPVSEEQTEIIIALLSAYGYESFEEQEENLIAFIPEDDFAQDEIIEIAYVEDCIKSGTFKKELILDKNWNEVWESNYPSVTISNRCYVRAPFHDHDPDVDFEIIIKPKMAFGTAHHETTAMVLELILDNDFSGKRVLDMGCGSGVLSILASMKKASSIVAIDIDSWSYDNTVENAEINNIENIEAAQGGAELIANYNAFDVILANINKNILLRDMKYYAPALVEGGIIYFSGFYVSDLKDIENEAASHNLLLDGYIEKNNWVAAKFIKKN